MPKYVVFRTVGKLSEEEIVAASLRSIETLDRMPQVRWTALAINSATHEWNLRGR